MIKVVARTIVREECIEAYHTLAKELVEETQKESGNISYTLNQSLENKKLHAMIEVWESREALDAHMASEHFKRIVPQIWLLTRRRSIRWSFILRCKENRRYGPFGGR